MGKEKSSFGICVTEPTAGGIKALQALKEAICWLRLQCRETILQSWVWDCGDLSWAVISAGSSTLHVHPAAQLELQAAGSHLMLYDKVYYIRLEVWIKSQLIFSCFLRNHCVPTCPGLPPARHVPGSRWHGLTSLLRLFALDYSRYFSLIFAQLQAVVWFFSLKEIP